MDDKRLEWQIEKCFKLEQQLAKAESTIKIYEASEKLINNGINVSHLETGKLLAKRLHKCKQQLAKAEEVIRFYGNKDQYDMNFVMHEYYILEDGGSTAREYFKEKGE